MSARPVCPSRTRWRKRSARRSPTETGSVLGFLPGQREIERTAERLEGRLPDNCDVVPLYGQLDGKAQDAAIRPATSRPPQGGARHIHRRDLDHHRRRARGHRFRVWPRLPRYEPRDGADAAGDGASIPRLRRPARRARRTRSPASRSGCGGAEQTAALPAFTPPEILQEPTSPACCSTARRLRRRRSDDAALPSTRAPGRRSPRRALLLLGLDAIDEARPADRIRRKRCASPALPARRALMVAEAGPHRTDGDGRRARRC